MRPDTFQSVGLDSLSSARFSSSDRVRICEDVLLQKPNALSAVRRYLACGGADDDAFQISVSTLIESIRARVAALCEEASRRITDSERCCADTGFHSALCDISWQLIHRAPQASEKLYLLAATIARNECRRADEIEALSLACLANPHSGFFPSMELRISRFHSADPGLRASTLISAFRMLGVKIQRTDMEHREHVSRLFGEARKLIHRGAAHYDRLFNAIPASISVAKSDSQLPLPRYDSPIEIVRTLIDLVRSAPHAGLSSKADIILDWLVRACDCAALLNSEEGRIIASLVHHARAQHYYVWLSISGPGLSESVTSDDTRAGRVRNFWEALSVESDARARDEMELSARKALHLLDTSTLDEKRQSVIAQHVGVDLTSVRADLYHFIGSPVMRLEEASAHDVEEWMMLIEKADELARTRSSDIERLLDSNMKCEWQDLQRRHSMAIQEGSPGWYYSLLTLIGTLR